MAIRTRDVLRIIVERIARAHPHPALFGFSEICDWPTGALHTLMRAGLLTEADRAHTILCPGCEWQCHKCPIVRLDRAGRRRAYISCNEEPLLGRICVPLRFLHQYQSDARLLGECLAGLMGFGAPRPLASGNAYAFGRVNGRHGGRMVGLLVAEEQIDVTVGDHSELLLNVMLLSRSSLAADLSFIMRLANRKAQTSHHRWVADRSRQHARKRKTQARDAAIYKKAKMLKTPGRTWSEAARAIAGTELAAGLSFERIRKIISEKHRFERK